MRNGVTDIFVVDLESRAITNVTKDSFADYAPTWTPDGGALIVTTRVSGNEKLFRVELADGKRTQLTFGTHDEGGAQFLDDKTLLFASTAVDPNEAVDPEVAKNGAIYNIWTLGVDRRAQPLHRRRRRQPLAGGPQGRAARGRASPSSATTRATTACISSTARPPLGKATTEDFGAPGPIVDFQAPLTHTHGVEQRQAQGPLREALPRGPAAGQPRRDQQRRLPGRHGDRVHRRARRLSSSRCSPLRSRSTGRSRGRTSTSNGASSTPCRASCRRSSSTASTRTSSTIRRSTASSTATWPSPPRRRAAARPSPSGRSTATGALEISGGVVNYEEEFEDPGLEQYSQEYQQEQYGRRLLNNGTMVPIGLTFVQETTVFREFGPLAGNTVRLAYEVAPPIPGTLTRQTVDADLRKYFRLGGSGLLAFRARGYKSWGDNPGYYYFGGNGEMRGYEYLAVRRPERRPSQRRAAHPAHPRHGHADRHPRRHPRHALRQRRRRVVGQTSRLQGLVERHDDRAPGDRLHADRR